MKKRILLIITAVLVLTLLFSSVASAAPKEDCGSILNGGVYYSAGHYLEGQPIPLGYDDYGYNYQAHMFNGSYANAYLGGYGFPPYTGDDESYLAENPSVVNYSVWQYRNEKIMMQWNDAWLSNMDRDGDGKLDRHFGYASYIGSGAWLTNKMYKYNCKIAAVPADANKADGIWYTADGVQVGPDIWGEFAVIQENDRVSKIKYVSPYSPGFGQY